MTGNKLLSSMTSFKLTQKQKKNKTKKKSHRHQTDYKFGNCRTGNREGGEGNRERTKRFNFKTINLKNPYFSELINKQFQMFETSCITF